MKVLKNILIGFLVFIFSFFTIFTILEIIKHNGNEELFRARQPYDLVIKNARIIDGTGDKVFRGEIGIQGEKIIYIGKNIETEGVKKIFDAAGYTIAPQKVEWSSNLDGIERDLRSALLRYDPKRIIINDKKYPQWKGRSAQALFNEESLSESELENIGYVEALILPELKEPKGDTIVNAFHKLTGWRGEYLEKEIGKIKENYPANLAVFNHRQIEEAEVLKYLQQEKMPPSDYLIQGTKIKKIKTKS